MVCRLFGAKQSSESLVTYCQVDPKEQNSVKYQSKLEDFQSRKCVWKCRLRNGGHFVSARTDELRLVLEASWSVALATDGCIARISTLFGPQCLLRGTSVNVTGRWLGTSWHANHDKRIVAIDAGQPRADIHAGRTSYWERIIGTPGKEDASGNFLKGLLIETLNWNRQGMPH